jgi:hypothetical protein
MAEEQYNLKNRNIGVQFLESAYRFGLGSIAGGLICCCLSLTEMK